jgi:hypothetical protein
MWTHGPDADADHAHSREVETVMFPDPPADPKLPDADDSVT